MLIVCCLIWVWLFVVLANGFNLFTHCHLMKKNLYTSVLFQNIHMLCKDCNKSQINALDLILSLFYFDSIAVKCSFLVFVVMCISIIHQFVKTTNDHNCRNSFQNLVLFILRFFFVFAKTHSILLFYFHLIRRCCRRRWWCCWRSWTTFNKINNNENSKRKNRKSCIY